MKVVRGNKRWFPSFLYCLVNRQWTCDKTLIQMERKTSSKTSCKSNRKIPTMNRFFVKFYAAPFKRHSIKGIFLWILQNRSALLFCGTSAGNCSKVTASSRTLDFTKKSFHHDFPRCFPTFFETYSYIREYLK